MSTEIEEVNEEEEEVNEEEQPCDVILNVYVVSSPFNLLFALFGFYLTSVEVNGVEYTFRADHGGNDSGVIAGSLDDGENDSGVDLWDTVSIGTTRLKTSQILEKIEALKQEFRRDSYNFFTKNCNHFSDRLCRELTGDGIPAYVNRMSKIGALCKCFIPADDSNEEPRRNEISKDGDGGNNENNGGGEGLTDVYLNVYDVSKIGSPLMRLLGVGLYRSTIQVHDREYAFRPKPRDGWHECIISNPRGELGWREGLRLHKSIRIGRTQLDEEQVSDLVYGLQDEFNLASYHHFTRNCHHFADRVCRELTGNGIPTWVNRVAMICG